MKKAIIKLIAVICSFAVLMSSAAVTAYATEADADYTEYFELILNRYEELLIGSGELDTENDAKLAEKTATISEETRGYLETMTAADTWVSNGEMGYIWEDIDPMKAEAFIRYSYVWEAYKRVLTMAQAYRIGESDLKGNEKLKNTILAAMDFMCTKWYGPDIEQSGNWAYWQLHIPTALNKIAVLMRNEMTAEQIQMCNDSVDAFPPQAGHVMTGANLCYRSGVQAIRGALGYSAQHLESAQKGFTTLTSYTTSGDGFYEDGSFIQHKIHPYTNMYGAQLLDILAPVLASLADTPWDVDEEHKQNITNFIYDSFEAGLYKGQAMKILAGRSGGSATSMYAQAYQILGGIIILADSVDEEDSIYFKSLAKHHIQSCESVYDHCAQFTVGTYLKAKKILDDEAIVARESYEMAQVYYNMDRVIQHNNSYSLGLGMHSKRISAFEKMNGNNIRGWYVGSGALFVYTDDLTKFWGSNWWCVVDPHRLPGTTVLRGVADLPAENNGITAQGQNAYAGGTTLYGLYATAGLQLQPYEQTLNAKKSYFMFDDEIVALGTDISATDGTTVETTIENMMLNEAGDNKFIVDGVEKSTALTDNTETITDMNWAHLEGNTENSSIGYYFPNGGSVNVIRENRMGYWAMQDKGGVVDDYTEHYENFLTMYYDHGKTPTNGEYAYVLLPTATADETKAYSENSDIEVLANNEDVQAAIDNTLNITGANFWNNKETTVYKDGEEWITSNGAVSAMVGEKSGEITIGVSDPTQENTNVICLEVNTSAASVVSKHEDITVLQTSPSVIISVDLNSPTGYKGETKEITLTAGESADTTVAAPEITSNTQLVIRENVAVTSYLEFKGSRPLEFAISDAPDGVTLDRFGTLYVAADLPIGNYQFDITVSNAYGSDTKTYALMKRNSALVANWKFDEGEGDTFADSVLVNRSSELANGADWTADGYSGSALEFAAPASGSSAPVAVVIGTSNLNFTERIEIDFQVNFDENPVGGRTQLLLEKRAVDGYVPYAVRVSNDGKIGLQWNNVWYESQAMDWNTDEWYRIYVRHDGHKIIFERNGMACGYVVNTDTAEAVSSRFAIGAGKTATNCFVGKIDEVSLALPNEKGGLQITSLNSTTFIPNNLTEYQITVNDTENEIIYGLADAPEGISIDESGILSLTGNVAAGDYEFYLTASYNDIPDAAQKFYLTVTQNFDNITPSKSVVYYSFNEGSGTYVATNSTIGTIASTNDLNANISESTEWVEGFVGSGLEFDSVSDTLSMIKVADPDQDAIGLNPTKSVFGGSTEFDFWIKFNENPADREQLIFAKNHSTANIPYAIKVNTDGQIGYCWAGNWVYSDSLDWNTGEWYHITVNHNKDLSVSIERDGNKLGVTGSVSSYVYVKTGIHINGGKYFSSSNYLNATLDEFFIGAKGGGESVRMRSKVSFNTDGGSLVEPQYIYLGGTADAPKSPTKSKYSFLGWYTDAEYTTEYDFSTPVTTDITLYAKWEFGGDITPSGSVIYYNFNEGEGTTVNTKTTLTLADGTDTTATISSGVEWVDGFVGSAIKFDALSDTLKGKASSAIDNAGLGMSPFSADVFANGTEYDFWIKLNVLPSVHEQYIFHRNHSGGGTPYGAKITTDGKLGFIWGSTYDWILSDTLEWNTDEWYHINIVHLKDKSVTVKRDGIIVGIGTTGTTTTGSKGVVVMNTGNKVSETSYFDGVIDEFYMGVRGGSDEIRLRSKVIFETNGGSEVEVQYPYVNETATIPEVPIRKGYTFVGWYSNAEYTTEYDFTQLVSADTVLYAKWEKNVIYGDANGDGEVATEDMSILRQYLIGTLTTEIADISILDVNADGAVDLKDLVRYKKYFAGLVTALGPTEV